MIPSDNTLLLLPLRHLCDLRLQLPSVCMDNSTGAISASHQLPAGERERERERGVGREGDSEGRSDLSISTESLSPCFPIYISLYVRVNISSQAAAPVFQTGGMLRSQLQLQNEGDCNSE